MSAHAHRCSLRDSASRCQIGRSWLAHYAHSIAPQLTSPLLHIDKSLRLKRCDSSINVSFMGAEERLKVIDVEIGRALSLRHGKVEKKEGLEKVVEWDPNSGISIMNFWHKLKRRIGAHQAMTHSATYSTPTALKSQYAARIDQNGLTDTSQYTPIHQPSLEIFLRCRSLRECLV
jgi:hypothetical protein